MAAHTLSATEDFVREQFNETIEEHRPIGPVAKAILDVLLTETTSHVGQDEVRGANVQDANRFVVRLALGVLADRYSREVVMLILSLDQS